MLSLSVMGMQANEINVGDSLYKEVPVGDSNLLMPLKPTYLKTVSGAANWGSNWFIEAKGGAPLFLEHRLVVATFSTEPCLSFR